MIFWKKGWTSNCDWGDGIPGTWVRWGGGLAYPNPAYECCKTANRIGQEVSSTEIR
jgi:hypothetical protein